MAAREISIGAYLAGSMRTCFVVAALALLASCYVPDEYTAEIRITRAGHYGITYSCVLMWVPLYGQVVRGEVRREEAAEQSAGFLTALKADSHFTSVSSLGQGRFEVRYDRRGRFNKTQMLSFVRRNARIIDLRAFEDGRVLIAGKSPTDLQADQLQEIGLQTRGLMRIVTDAPVLQHNATSVRPSPTPGYTIYDWNVTSFRQPAPRLELKLDGRLPSTAS